MSDFSFDGPADEPDLTAVTRSDRLLDALATCRPVESFDFDESGDRALAALLTEWRDELRLPSADDLVSVPEAIAALERNRLPGRRPRRGMTLVGTVAATVLALGGVGALVGGAQPGDALYGVRATVFGEPPSVHDDRIALTAKTELERVAQMITAGQWDQAQDKLTTVSNNVQTVNDERRKKGLIDQVNRLHAKVTNRNPNG